MQQTVQILKTVTIPDKISIERYRKVPELGPRILFFSGGTALKKLSKQLINYTHNSIHIVTSFDSGGSSAELRDSFKMLSVGDLRNRMMALADQSVKGNPSVYRLFAYRLPIRGAQNKLIKELLEIIDGAHHLITAVKEPMKSIICDHIQFFYRKMPENFDLRGASIGNIILAGGYLNNNNNIDTVLYMFTKLVEARGIVKAVDSRFLDLVAKLENGKILIGQHYMTGKEISPITSPIKKIYLTDDRKTAKKVNIEAKPAITKLISKADLICYPMGSFFTSILANLLPENIPLAIAANPCPKVYVPNTTEDPEQYGMKLSDSVEILKTHLKSDVYKTENLLNFIIVDNKHDIYPYPLELDKIEKSGIRIIESEIVTEESYPYIDSEKLINVLLSLT